MSTKIQETIARLRELDRYASPALLAEIERLTARLSIAEARLGRVAANHPDAYLAALEGDKE